MRVSNRQMTNIVKSDLFRNAQQLLKSQERVATRKLINKPSDDPIGMGKVLDYRKTLSSIDQYNNNIVSAKSRTEFTDTLLENLHDLVDQAKQVAIAHSNELDPELRQGAAQQIEGIYDQILGIANTKYDGNYLFAGHDTDTIPFPRDEVTTGAGSTLSGGESFNISSSTADYYVWYNIDPPPNSTDPATAGRIGIEVTISATNTAEEVASATQTAINTIVDEEGVGVFTASLNGSEVKIISGGEGVDATDNNSGFYFLNKSYNGDNGKINIMVGEDAKVRINLTGDEVFTGAAVASGTNLFDDLKTLGMALKAEPPGDIIPYSLADNLEKGVNQIESAAVKQSITYRRLETTENHWVKFKDSVVNMLSRIEDADLATAIVELQAQETAYEAALATAAKMFNRKSLIDFL